MVPDLRPHLDPVLPAEGSVPVVGEEVVSREVQ